MCHNRQRNWFEVVILLLVDRLSHAFSILMGENCGLQQHLQPLLRHLSIGLDAGQEVSEDCVDIVGQLSPDHDLNSKGLNIIVL